MKGPWNLLSRGPPNQIKRSPQPLDSYLCTVFCLMSLEALSSVWSDQFSFPDTLCTLVCRPWSVYTCIHSCSRPPHRLDSWREREGNGWGGEAADHVCYRKRMTTSTFVRYARSKCLYATLFATFFDVFMPP
jgi:hypothetical protein